MTRVKYTYCEGCYVTPKMVAKSDIIEVMNIISQIKALFYKNHATNAFNTLDADNLTKLKKLVKMELKNLGVLFDDEVRPNLRKKK